MKKALVNIMAVVSVAIMAWFMFSVVEVNAKNDSPNPEYSAMNLFELVC